MARDTATQDDQ